MVVESWANIAYMTGLLATRVGAASRVVAFEPHHVVVQRLRGNVSRLATRPGVALVDVHQTGLSASTGEAGLVEDAGSDENHGLARIT